MGLRGEIIFKIMDSKGFSNNINNEIGFNPSKVITKGQQISSFITADCNIWGYKVSFSNNEDMNKNIVELIDKLLMHSTAIRETVIKYESVKISFYIRADSDQMGFEIPPDIISKLYKLGIGVDFHIILLGLDEE